MTQKRKRAALALWLLLLAGLLTSCAGMPGGNVPGVTDAPGTSGSQTTTDSSRFGQSAQYDNDNENKNGTDFPGSYTVPEGWAKMERYSTENKIFYAEEGHEDDEMPDNISIEVGTNRYGADEHEKFREAILRQLAVQFQGVDAELTGDGTFTEQDYVVYIFTISQEDVVTKQYYIVGDQRYCLVHLTNFTGSESVDEAARAMADSFVWDSPD